MAHIGTDVAEAITFIWTPYIGYNEGEAKPAFPISPPRVRPSFTHLSAFGAAPKARRKACPNALCDL
jgi:hypothetical protein